MNPGTSYISLLVQFTSNFWGEAMRPIILCSLLLLAAMTAQADDNLLCPVPVFAECPDTLTADCGDTIRYQFQLLDQRNGQPRADARYFIARGHGFIDSLTGELTIWRIPDSRYLPGKMQIGARFVTSPRADTAFCEFLVIACKNAPPRILGNCPAELPPFRAGLSVTKLMRGFAICGTSNWSVIPPPDSGVSAVIDQQGNLLLSGQTVGHYTVQVILTDSCGADTCEVNFTITGDNPYAVRIEQIRNQIQGQYALVDVTADKVQLPTGLGAYDLLIKYDNSALTLSEVIEGDIFAQCGWEYFTYRIGADGNCPECPSGLVRVIGIAETNNGDDHPTCDVPDSLPATLFRMKFLVSNDRTLECQYIPIQFYWRDCDDNQLASNDDHLIKLIADRVFDSVGAMFPIDSSSAFLPGTNGLPWQTCQTAENEKPSIRRLVDFYHGGIGIVCRDSIDTSCRGDLDGDGIAYSGWDYSAFRQILLIGPANIEDFDSVCTDINFDSVGATIEDLVFLYRIARGKEFNFNQPTDTAEFAYSNDTLFLSSIDTLGALLLTVRGCVYPSAESISMPMDYFCDGEFTRIIVAPHFYTTTPDSLADFIFPGAILTGLEGHEILSIETADYHGGKMFASLSVTTPVKYEVAIQRNHMVGPEGPFSADVSLLKADHSRGIGGFQFLIAYPKGLGLDSVVPGVTFSECGWEYFTYRVDTAAVCDTCSFGKVKVVALFDINNGPYHPDTTCPETLPAKLFTMNFHVADRCLVDCIYQPLRFYWEGCDDNIISDVSGNYLNIALHVFDYHDYDHPVPYELATFPGFAGVPRFQCDVPAPFGPEPIRSISFYNGGFDIACSDSIDARGDLDLDDRLFEIEDEVLFARYLVLGDSVFHINLFGQRAATDINGDNIVPAVADFVLHHRIVHGYDSAGCYFVPPPDSPDTAIFSVTDERLYVSTQDTLGAVLISFVGNIWPREIVAGMKVLYRFDGAVTRILVAPDVENPSSNAYILSGPIFYGVNQGQILSIEAATWRGAKIASRLAGESQSPIAITINKVRANYADDAGPTIICDVTLQRLATDHGIGGFDLLITYEDMAMSVDEVIPGSLLSTCGWEYFTWRLENGELCQTDCDGGLLRVIGLAEINNGSPIGETDCGPAGWSLFGIKFRLDGRQYYECSTVPVDFYWTSCEDNQIVSSNGSERYLAHQVYSHRYPWLIQTPFPQDSASFPGIKGVPIGMCDELPSSSRAVDFFHGSVEIPCQPMDITGDLNLNGLAYEVADETLFAAYFLNGLPAFTINPLAQEATSDINRDGTMLTVEDYVLMHRIINGWALPHDNPPASPDTVRFLHTFGPLYAATDDTLGAVAIVVAGNIAPLSMLNNMVMEYAFDGTNTHIFIHAPHGSPDSTAYILAGPIVNLQSVNEILSISTCTHRGNRIASRVDIVSDAGEGDDPNIPATFALHQNYPNPFNAGTVISFDLPRTAEVNLEIINVLGNVVYRKKMTCSAGTQQINWNGITTGGSEVASGVYYYRLTAGSFTDTKKMLLLK
jgi:hypothetical protein